MTIKRMRFLQDLLKFVGMGERLHLEWISSAEAQKFVRTVTDFTEKIRSLGPSPISDFTEKVNVFMGPRPLSANCETIQHKQHEKLFLGQVKATEAGGGI